MSVRPIQILKALDRSHQNPGRLYFLLAIAGLLVWSGVLTLDVHTIVSRFAVDDTFYYLEIAKNIAGGRGVTFDGIHRTNGFQPLYQFLLVPVFWVVSDDITALYVVKGVEVVVIALAGVFLFRLAWRLSGSQTTAWFAFALFYVPGPSGLPFSKDLIIGMESGVNALMSLIMLNLWIDLQSEHEAPRWRYAVYGIIIGLVFLARLDSIFLIIGIGLLHVRDLYTSDNRLRLQRKLILGGVLSLLIALAYLYWNKLAFGYFEPISGRVLTWRSSLISNQLLSVSLMAWLANVLWFITRVKAVGALVIMGLGLIPMVLWLNRKYELAPLFLPRYEPVLKMIWGVCIVKTAYYSTVVQYPYNARYWYYVLEALLFPICGAMILNLTFQIMRFGRFTNWIPVFTFAVLGVSSWSVLNTKLLQEWEYVSFEELGKIESMVDSQQVIGSKDAGLLGYFLPNPVVNLDGLVNDEEFFSYLRRDELAGYVFKQDITYLVNLLDSQEADQFSLKFDPGSLQLLYRSDLSPAGDDRVYKIYRVIQ